MHDPRDRIRLMQENHYLFRFGSSDEYRAALPAALVDLAWAISWVVASAEEMTYDQLLRTSQRTEALLAAGRTIARVELKKQKEREVGAGQHWGAVEEER